MNFWRKGEKVFQINDFYVEKRGRIGRKKKNSILVRGKSICKGFVVRERMI